MLNDILSEVKLMSTDLDSVVNEIEIPSLPDISLDPLPKRSITDKKVTRKSWEKEVEARCDFQYRLRITKRAGLMFMSIWQKSVFGRTLTDIKSDDNMVPFFAENLVSLIQDVLGNNLQKGKWAVVATPMRRHLEQQVLRKPNAEELAPMLRRSQDSNQIQRIGFNFASRIAGSIGQRLGIPFYYDCAHCDSRHRVNAVFTANNIPNEPNIIVVDDFCTTGSTLQSMKNLLEAEHKNCVFFCGINNKL